MSFYLRCAFDTALRSDWVFALAFVWVRVVQQRFSVRTDPFERMLALEPVLFVCHRSSWCIFYTVRQLGAGYCDDKASCTELSCTSFVVCQNFSFRTFALHCFSADHRCHVRMSFQQTERCVNCMLGRTLIPPHYERLKAMCYVSVSLRCWRRAHPAALSMTRSWSQTPLPQRQRLVWPTQWSTWHGARHVCSWSVVRHLDARTKC